MENFICYGRHIGIPVVDIQLMKEFYCNLLGFAVLSDEIEEGEFISSILGINNAKLHVVKLKTLNGWIFEMIQYNYPSNKRTPLNRKIDDIGIAHLALTVDNLDKIYLFLKNHSIDFISAPKISPSQKAKVCFCKDPEGNYIELVELLEN